MSVVVAPGPAARVPAVALGVVIATYAAVGVLIAWRHPGHRVGRLVLLAVAVWGPGEALLDVAVGRVRSGDTQVTTRLAATLGDAARGFGWLLLILLLPLLFPDGRPAGTRRVRRAAWSAAVTTLATFLLAALLSPSSNDLRIPDLDNRSACRRTGSR